ncbi:hypothetical protein CGK32_24490, partial [Vibrio parahaemolyticus]
MLTDLALTLSSHPKIITYLDSASIIGYCAVLVWFLFIIQISAISSLLLASFKLVYNLFISKAFQDLDGLLKRKK